jgi:hypothetical protein
VTTRSPPKPERCVACGAAATLETKSWGARQTYCSKCGVPTDCIRCGEIPDRLGYCDCVGGRPTLAVFKAIA